MRLAQVVVCQMPSLAGEDCDESNPRLLQSFKSGGCCLHPSSFSLLFNNCQVDIRISRPAVGSRWQSAQLGETSYFHVTHSSSQSGRGSWQSNPQQVLKSWWLRQSLSGPPASASPMHRKQWLSSFITPAVQCGQCGLVMVTNPICSLILDPQ